MTVRADDVSGRIDVTGWFRSPLVNRKTSTALAHTSLIVPIGDAFGSEVEPDYCDAESGGMHVWVNLGKDTATVYATGPEAPPYDVPSTIAPDRLSVTTIVPARPFLPKLRPICLGRGLLDRMTAFASEVLEGPVFFDGRTPQDTPVGRAAASALRRSFRALALDVASRKRGRVAPGRVVGLRSRCTPPAGTQTVHCSARARIRELLGSPVITLSGRRTYRVVHKTVRTGPFGGTGRVLSWRQRLVGRLRWRSCPAVLGRSTGAPCSVGFVVRDGQEVRTAIRRALPRGVVPPPYRPT